MKWEVLLSRRSEKFLDKNKLLQKDIKELITLSIKLFQGESVSLNIRKLKGKWLGFYRVRRGDVRVIMEFDFDSRRIRVEAIDRRGGVYRGR
jgi:mRNA-degrading endonuclease RelE of RelBE toxin-antitoxin system